MANHAWSPYYPGYAFVAATAASSTPPFVQQTVTSATAVKYCYYVRLINPKRKSEYLVRMWHDKIEKFDSPAKLKLSLMDSFPSDIPNTTDFQMGYFEPPNNIKRWIVDARDLKEMYSCYEVGARINLWCDRKIEQIEIEQPQAKKKKDEGDEQKKTAKEGERREKKTADTEDIFLQLRAKHPKMEAPKLRLWAKLISSGHHESYDTPPPIPLITGAPVPTKPKNKDLTEALTGVATSIVAALSTKPSPPANRTSREEHTATSISPLRSTTIRRSCLEDLKKLKELLEDGVLKEDEYMEEKQQILATLRGLKK